MAELEDYVIQQSGSKGRSFSATCVGLVTADSLWQSGGNTIRPVWAMFAGSEHELRPFATNLKAGRKAERRNHRGGDDERLEFLRSVGYLVTWQREPEGSLVTLYHPELFRLDPGLVDPAGIRFVMLVPSDWAGAQRVDVGPPVRHVLSFQPPLTDEYRQAARAKVLDAAYLGSLVPAAYLFAAYVDRRTSCPLVADGRFYLQLLIAAFDQGLASLPGRDARYNSSRDEWGHHTRHGFNVEVGGARYSRAGIDSLGLRHAISFLATHADFEAFLSEQVTLFFAAVSEFRAVTETIDFAEICPDAALLAG